MRRRILLLPLPLPLRLASRHCRRLNTGPLTNLYDEAHAPALQVRNVSESGIELQDGLVYTSPCILFGGHSFFWRVPPQLWVGWSSDPFEIFNIVSPKPGQSFSSTSVLIIHALAELLLLGTGKTLLHPPPSIREYLRRAGISIDVMDTVSTPVVQPTPHSGTVQKNACSTFNLLSEEGRKVAAALLPL